MSPRIGATLASLLVATGCTLPGAEPADALRDPVAFESADGQLDIIMTATSAPVDFAGVHSTGWVYEICRRASARATTCIPGNTVSPYGGVWLKLRPDDRLNLRLVNRLPLAEGAKHCAENPALVNNPTNLHTHGLIVEPHRATGPGDPYGDYVFVEVRNPANAGNCAQPAAAAPGAAPAQAPAAGAGMSPHAVAAHAHGHGASPDGVHPDMDVADGAVEYAIDLVRHPSGLFWFHPHMHGLALNQVTAGLAGVITVGSPDSECQGNPGCSAAVAVGRPRIMVLKDSEVLADGTLLTQQDPGFCDPVAAAGEAPRRGACPGDATADPGFAGGRWFHTINGQVYPSVAVGERGEIWRIVNASASRSYDLSLEPEGGGQQPVPLQVISIDGITIDAAMAADLPRMRREFGPRLEVMRCPTVAGLGAASGPPAVCTTHLRMMPSARVTVRVLNDRREARRAVLRTAHFSTGPEADDWPAVDLAAVSRARPEQGVEAVLRTVGEVGQVLSALGALGAPPTVREAGEARPVPLAQAQRNALAAPRQVPPAASSGDAGMVLRQATMHAIDPALRMGLRRDPACTNLGPGERRRIYFGSPVPGQDGFALATVVVGADGREKPGTATPMTAFDPTTTTVCLTAARSGAPTTETWELVNTTGEDHNFHIHQTRFWLVQAGAGAADQAATVLEDNVPIPHAADVSACDGSVGQVQAGKCRPEPVVVRIPFTQIGDFVFHCHILEHEDGGMMARIRVVAPPARRAAGLVR